MFMLEKKIDLLMASTTVSTLLLSQKSYDG